ESSGVPALGRSALLVEGDERLRLLQMVPAGPADNWRRVGVAFETGVGDEAFLGHVELAAQLPRDDRTEVARAVLRRHRDVVDLLAGVLATLQIPRSLPCCPLANPGVLVAPRREVRHGVAAGELVDQRDIVDFARRAVEL